MTYIASAIKFFLPIRLKKQAQKRPLCQMVIWQNSHDR